MQNPFTRIKQRFPRYLAIALCTGSISFVVALILLHAGFSPFVCLAVSVLASGLFNYLALELWATPKRAGKLSWNRLIASSVVGGAAFALRWGILTFCLEKTAEYAPFDKAISLAIAYIFSFTFGYLLRSRIIFTHAKTPNQGNNP